jgi:hypothetical protein
MTNRFWPFALTGVVTLMVVASVVEISARRQAGGRQTAGAVSIDDDDIGGVVSSAKGPEAGVWVIAETTELPTRFIRSVVTDDQGRYVVPDLPKANYDVWVRGYGLIDSPKVRTAPGKTLNLTAVAAPDAHAAARNYPANYWYSLLQVPPKSDFPGTGTEGRLARGMTSQPAFISRLKAAGCEVCHQMGNKATREIPKSLGVFDSSMAAWDRRVRVGQGQAGDGMSAALNAIGRQRALAIFSDWTDRITAGELPPVPPRPEGLERNVVVTEWDYGDPKKYTHDGVSTDKRNPTVNANGPIYIAPEESSDDLYVVDPVRHTATALRVPFRDPNTPVRPPQKFTPSPYWGDEALWTSRTSPHSSMLDEQGRVWTASAIRPPENPAWCREGSSHPSAKHFPLTYTNRQLSVYDPKTKEWTLIDTCFGTHHLLFSEDTNNTLWFSNGGTGGGPVLAWFNTKMFDQTKDEQKSQGWTPFVLDTNGNGKQDAWVEPDQPPDPTKDTRLNLTIYSVVHNPVDNAIWASVADYPGAIIRVTLGSNPTTTALTEIFELPLDAAKVPVHGYTPRGLDVDRNGVIWTNLAGSSHLASFDRRKCKGPLNGPTATGQHCPEGWTFYSLPGPKFKGVTDEGGVVDGTYLMWVDQFDASGLGRNTPIAIGNGSDSIHALVNGRFVTLRVPYPLGFYAKGLDGRIDDSKAGWKGRGLYAGSGTRAPFHMETGKGSRPKLVKFQVRPDPLAK